MPPASYLCGAEQRYVRVPQLSKWVFTWPFMRLDLEPDAFVLRPLVLLRWMRRPARRGYDDVVEARLRTRRRYSRIYLRLADDSEGILSITTLNEGVVQLAQRLEERRIPLRRKIGP